MPWLSRRANPEDQKRHDAEVEQIAMHVARAHEEAAGAVVKDVHTPELARAAGLPDNPGFDLLSIRPGGEKRAIEVKGRAGVGDVEVVGQRVGQGVQPPRGLLAVRRLRLCHAEPAAAAGPRPVWEPAGQGQGQRTDQFD